MANEELNTYIREHTQPTALDIEIAKRVILEQLATASPSTGLIEASGLLSHVERALSQDPGPIPDDYVRSEPDLNSTKAEIAAREALNILHATGILIAFGPPRPNEIDERRVTLYTAHGSTQSCGPIYFPSIHVRYRLATAYQGQQKFRLAGGDIYLLYISHSRLPSRAVRCLKECGDAFRHGLYLSATMTVGAASESLWLELGHLVNAKNVPGITKLATELNKPMPNIGSVIEPTWNALLSHHDSLLKSIFSLVTMENAISSSYTPKGCVIAVTMRCIIRMPTSTSPGLPTMKLAYFSCLARHILISSQIYSMQ